VEAVPVSKLAHAVVSLVLLALLLSSGGESAYASPRGGHPRLDSRLQSVAEAFELGGNAAARDRASAQDIDNATGTVRVVVQFEDDSSSRMPAGFGNVETMAGNLVQAQVPFGRLKALSDVSGVARVRPPLTPYTADTSQGVSLTGAAAWQTQGLTGAGVKVAILDLGFEGYDDLLGTELPPTVTAMSFRADADITGDGEVHGTAVAEIIHDMAPGAQLYLANFDTEVELENASTWLTGQGVQVINASWGYFVSGPGDGTGPVNDLVTTSIANGAFWSISAANHAQKHWSGTFTDSDADSFHEYSGPADEGNALAGSFLGFMLPGEAMSVELKWDDPWGTACRDYDLYIVRPDGPDPGTTPDVVGSSENEQHDGVDCVPGAEPWESITATAPATDVYYAVIKEFNSSSDANLHLYSHVHDLDYQVSANSLGQPADNASALTNGAVNWSTPGTIEPFSSRGPTTNARTKPDVVTPDGVDTVSYPSAFFGTSAAAPHAAGITALTLERSPCLDPAELKSLLVTSTVDLGTPGPDNTFGSGRLLLGAPPPDNDGDGPSDDCDNCSSWANPAQTLPNWPIPAGDPDCDGFTSAQEAHVGTDPSQHCNATAEANDEPDAWPTDFNDNRFTSLADVSLFNPTYNKIAPDPAYDQRFDLNGSFSVTLADVSQLSTYYNKSCG